MVTTQKLTQFTDHWSPKVISSYNNNDIMVVKAQGEFYVVPKGVEHCPVATEEVHLLLIEPKGTPNTGDKETAVDKVEI